MATLATIEKRSTIFPLIRKRMYSLNNPAWLGLAGRQLGYMSNGCQLFEMFAPV